MKRILSQLRANERGLILPLVLILLAVGMLTIVPFVSYMYSGSMASNISHTRLVNEYAAGAGAEDAIWRLTYEEGFKESIGGENPMTSYSTTVNGTSVNITVAGMEYEEPVIVQPEPSWRWGMVVYKTVDPDFIALPMSGPVTVDYTITIDNDASLFITYFISQIKDLLPLDTTYITGSASGLTTSDPAITVVNGQQELLWTFNPKPGLDPDAQLTLSFSAEVDFNWPGIYYNIPQVYCDDWHPYNAGLALGMVAGWTPANELAPIVACLPPYNITAQAGNATVRARIDIGPSGPIILSWRVE